MSQNYLTTQTRIMEVLTTLAQLKQQDKGQMAGIRMAIPAEFDDQIKQFQDAWRACHGKGITKEHTIWIMMDLASEALLDETSRLEKEAAVKAAI